MKGFIPTCRGVTLTTQRFYYLHAYRDDLMCESPGPRRRERRHLGGNYYAIRKYDGDVVIRYGDEEEPAVAPVDPVATAPRIPLEDVARLCDKTGESHDDGSPDKEFEKEGGGDSPESNPEMWYDAKRARNNVREFDEHDCQSIKLSPTEIKAVIDLYPRIENECRELRSCIPCITDHLNQMSYYQCPECSPEQTYAEL